MRFTKNDAGRSASRRSKQRNDCVIRAIAIVFEQDYDEVYDLFAKLGRKSGRGVAKRVWQKRLNAIADRTPYPAVAGQPRMSLADFAATDGREGRWVVQCAGHLVAVIDGVVHDDGRPRSTACVYAVWSPLV